MNVPSPPHPDWQAPTNARRPPPWRIGVAMIGALVAMTSSARPTGDRVGDLLWLALVGAALTYSCSRARRLTLVVSCAIAAIAAVGRPDVLVVGCVTLVVISVAATRTVRRPWVHAICGVGFVFTLLHLSPDRHPVASIIWFVAAVGPVAVSAYRNAPRPERRRIRRLGAAAGLSAVILSTAVATTAFRAQTLIADGVEAIDAARSLATTDVDSSIGEISRAGRHFAAAASTFDTPWLVPARWVPVTAQHLRVASVATVQSTHATASTGDLLTAYGAGQAVGSAESGFDLAMIAALEDPVRRLDTTLQTAATALDEADSPWLLPQVAGPYDTAIDQLDTAQHAVEIASRSIGIAPDLLGEGRTARWLIAVTNPTESRFQGGFLASYLLVEINDGEIEVAASGSSGELVDRTGDEGRTLTAPAEFIARYATRYQPTRYFQNLTASPDPAMNAVAIAELFPQTGGGELDGIVFADPMAVEALVGLLPEPLALPQTTKLLDGSNTADHLLRDQYLTGDPADVTARRDQLDSIALEAVAQLAADRPPIAELAPVIRRAVERGHLSIHAVDPGAARVIDDAGLAGQRPEPPTINGADDVLSVRTANAGRNKLDMFLERQIDYHVDVIGPAIRSELTVRLHNGSPSDGLPLYVMGSDGKRTEQLGRNTQFVSIYSPLDLVAASIDGRPATFEFGTEGGLNTYSRLLDIGPMESISIELELEGTRPAGHDDRPFRLDLWQQPTVNPDLIRLAAGSATTRWNPQTASSAVIQRDGSLIRSAVNAPLLSTIVFDHRSDDRVR